MASRALTLVNPQGISRLVGDAPAPKAEEDYYTEEVQARPAQLAPHDIDVPEEPEYVEVVQQVWDPATQRYTEVSMGKMLLVPTGCDHAEYVSPYETTAKLRSALPRDRAEDANLYAMYQKNQWMGRHTIMEKLEEGINIAEEDKRIIDDIPLALALQGLPDPSQVGQTAGNGDNNGAPPPPGPGPGRGNKFGAGDNMAQAPPNGAPGTGV